jgi:hypothetical protein
LKSVLAGTPVMASGLAGSAPSFCALGSAWRGDSGATTGRWPFRELPDASMSRRDRLGALAQEAGMARPGLTDDQVARVPLFEGLSKRQLAQVASLMNSRPISSLVRKNRASRKLDPDKALRDAPSIGVCDL